MWSTDRTPSEPTRQTFDWREEGGGARAALTLGVGHDRMGDSRMGTGFVSETAQKIEGDCLYGRRRAKGGRADP